MEVHASTEPVDAGGVRGVLRAAGAAGGGRARGASGASELPATAAAVTSAKPRNTSRAERESVSSRGGDPQWRSLAGLAAFRSSGFVQARNHPSFLDVDFVEAAAVLVQVCA